MTEPATELKEEIIDVRTSDGEMAVIRKRPSDGTSPGVVMFHDGPGIRNATHVFARNLARLGYDVIVPTSTRSARHPAHPWTTSLPHSRHD